MAKNAVYCYDDEGDPCHPAAFTKPDEADLETYEADLDFYYNQYDYECGLKSIGLGGMEEAFNSDGCRHKWSDGSTETVHMRGGHGGNPVNDPWSDERHLKAFSRGRMVWRRLGQVSYADQQTIKAFYSPSYPREKDQDWGPPIPTRNAIVEAIASYRKAASS